MRAAGGRSLGVKLDVTDAASARAAVEAAVASFGGLHILVNNAGIDRRLAEVAAHDIAGVIAFLASDGAAYVNGASLDANGGIFMA